MGKSLKCCVLFFGMALLFGCAGQKSTGITANRSMPGYNSATTATLTENDPAVSNKVIKKAKSAIGTPYVLGGSEPGGFDCSGLVKWAYNSVGVELPRTAREQSVVGKKIKNVNEMRAGDIVAFRHPRRGYHTGIYLGNGKFVHSPRTRSHVRINSLSDPYFSRTLLGARRVNMDGSENLVAQAESRLRAYVAEKSQLSLSRRNLEKIRSSAKKHQLVAKNSKQSHKTVVAKKSASKHTHKIAHAKNKKSTIAQTASKIKSVKQVTGKIKTNVKNSEAHTKLANASRKATHKTVSMLSSKKINSTVANRRHRSHS